MCNYCGYIFEEEKSTQKLTTEKIDEDGNFLKGELSDENCSFLPIEPKNCEIFKIYFNNLVNNSF